MQLLCTWDCLLSGSPQSQREDYDKTGSQPFAGSMSKVSTGSQLFAGSMSKVSTGSQLFAGSMSKVSTRFPAVCWNMSRRQASNGICGIVCVTSIFMCLELWVDRGRSPHQSHVGGVAPALLPTLFIPHARVAALVL